VGLKALAIKGVCIFGAEASVPHLHVACRQTQRRTGIHFTFLPLLKLAVAQCTVDKKGNQIGVECYRLCVSVNGSAELTSPEKMVSLPFDTFRLLLIICTSAQGTAISGSASKQIIPPLRVEKGLR
jgi:hypothetical protein